MEVTNKIQTHSSTPIFYMHDIKMVRRCQDLLMTAPSFKNRRTFLTNYIQEKIIPTSMSSVLRPPQHIFPDYIRLFLETSICDLKISEAHTFEKSQIYRIRTSSKTRNDSKSFSINKRNINSTQYF